MNKRTNKDYQRIWFDFHTDSIKRLDNLALETDSNRPEVVKRALRMYEFVLNEQKTGKEFIIKDTKTNSQTLIAPIAI